MVKDKVGRCPGELGVNKSPWNVILFLRCFDTVGCATGMASGL